MFSCPSLETKIQLFSVIRCWSVLNDSLSGFLKVHSRATAPLEMTEDFSGQ